MGNRWLRLEAKHLAAHRLNLNYSCRIDHRRPCAGGDDYRRSADEALRCVDATHSSGHDLHILHSAAIYQLNAKLFITAQQRLRQPPILDLNIIRKSQRATHPFRQAWLKCPRLFVVQPFNLKPFASLPVVTRSKPSLFFRREGNIYCAGQIELYINS